ncbi:hypothetical protein [Rhodobacter sp. 24-YEA-8]|uniref:hypothetical protein n=1 Tax=Rhodobacter sp. 24-YEA-8 TaxID=1884310 RepID=UPI00373FD4B8
MDEFDGVDNDAARGHADQEDSGILFELAGDGELLLLPAGKACGGKGMDRRADIPAPHLAGRIIPDRLTVGENAARPGRSRRRAGFCHLRRDR